MQVIAEIFENNRDWATWSGVDAMTHYRAFKRSHNRRPSCGFNYSVLEAW